MNLIAQLQFTQAAQAERKPPRDNRASHEARRRNTLNRYTQVFNGQERTTPEIACRLGIAQISAFIQMTRFESRGLAVRVGTRSTGGKPAIIWKWVG
jgi:hypothetical protein